MEDKEKNNNFEDESLNFSELEKRAENGGSFDVDEIEKLQAQIMAQYQDNFPTYEEENKQEEPSEEYSDFAPEETEFKDFEEKSEFSDFAPEETEFKDFEENDIEKKEQFADFEDFADDKIENPQNFDSEVSLFHQDMSTSKEDDLDEDKISVPEFEQDETQSLDVQQEEQKQQNDELSSSYEEFENQKDEKQEDISDEISQWEELSEDNSVVKKYITYISKDFVPYLDSLSVNDRMAYINDAIQMKMDSEDNKKQEAKKVKAKVHLILVILTFLIMTPIALLGVNKAIMVTFENYKYSQDNFEKLYKQRFEKDSAYMRSVEYNKELERRMKIKR